MAEQPDLLEVSEGDIPYHDAEMDNLSDEASGCS